MLARQRAGRLTREAAPSCGDQILSPRPSLASVARRHPISGDARKPLVFRGERI